MAKTRHDKDFDLQRQWDLFKERCHLTEPLPEDQEREMKKAFYGAAGQLILMMRDDIADLSMDDGVQVLKRLLNQVQTFFEEAVAEHAANVGQFQPTDKARWELDVLEDDVYQDDSSPMRVRVVKKPDDPECTRASCGGDEAFGYYITYRGELPAVEMVLKGCLKAVTNLMIHKKPGKS